MDDKNFALMEAREPGSLYCPICGEELIAPMDKLSIGLFGKCVSHIEDESEEQEELLETAKSL